MKLTKLFLICSFIFLTSTSLLADYSTPGTGVSWGLAELVTNSAGTVTFSGGFYFVNSNLTITSPDTLKILANATVKIAQSVTWNTLGTLIINPPDSVKITAVDTSLRFQELRLDDLSDASVIRKLIFEYSYNGFRMLDCNPLIEQSTFRYNCNTNTTTSTAISLFRSNATIRNCRIHNNYRVGIAGGGNISNAPQILNNLIYDNNMLNGNVPQINLGGSGSNTTVIRGNTITGGSYLQAGGIALFPVGGSLTAIIENNIIKKNRYGITVQSTGNVIIRGNTIDSNNIQNSPNLGGSGINLVGSGVTAIVSKNLIRGNLWGITTQSRSNLVLGDLTSSDTNYIGQNQIYFNNNTGVFYDLYNNTINNIKAENNYWGTNIADSVEAHIVHQPDNDSGFVDYLPLWVPTGIQQVNSNIPGNFTLYEAYPNPFNPETNIKFDIPLGTSSDVSLIIYDALGRTVDVVVNEKLSPGSYIVQWNASKYSSGIYFYRLQHNGSSAVKKLVLVK